jgi:hypothetical protein
MNSIIWWLESPWQIRAFVFFLSFVACFVAPWLYSSGTLGMTASRKSLLTENDAKPALTVEAPLPQAQSPALEKAASQQAPALAQAKAPLQETQAPVLAPASDQAEAPPQQAQALVPAPAPDQAEAPPQQAQAPIPAAAPSQPERLAAVDAPALSAPAAAQFAGGFHISNTAKSALSIPSGSPVEKQEISVTSESGGTAKVDVYLLSNRANWSFGRSDRFVDASNRHIELSSVLNNDAFAKKFRVYDAVICLGLGSRSRVLSIKETNRLVDKRAVHLCGLLAGKPFVRHNAKIFGLPLGQNLEAKAGSPEEERKQRSIVIIGIKSATGDLAGTAKQKKMISEIIRGDKLSNFPLSSYSEVTSGKELRYIEAKPVKLRHKRRPIKPKHWAPRPEFLWDEEDEISGRERKLRHRRRSRDGDDSCALWDRSALKVRGAASQPLPIGNWIASARSPASALYLARLLQSEGTRTPPDLPWSVNVTSGQPRGADSGLNIAATPTKEVTRDGSRERYRIAFSRVA